VTTGSVGWQRQQLTKRSQVALLVLGVVGPQHQVLLEVAIDDARPDKPDERPWLFVFRVVFEVERDERPSHGKVGGVAGEEIVEGDGVTQGIAAGVLRQREISMAVTAG
jgi:hypothetical protein